MVIVTSVLNSSKKTLRYSRHFIDSLRLNVRAGTGGNGLPKYGGAGGEGGSIYFEADENESLLNVVKSWPTKRIVAGHGENSHQNKILGQPGVDQIIKVPVGVRAYKDKDNQLKHLGDLDENGYKIKIATGGIGGNYKNGWLGTKGDIFNLVLDLRLIADIGLVGFPNAGKSTLLRNISRAKPKVASYPFTTIRPTIGQILYKDLRTITMADLPGLIEGAHQNIGMGHKFLKHVERTKLLLILVDINGFQLNPKYEFRSCLETIVLLNKELELYKKELLDKPAVLVINKMDTNNADDKYKKIKNKINCLEDHLTDFPEEFRPLKTIKFENILTISAKYGKEDLEVLKNCLRDVLDKYDAVDEDLEDFKKLKDYLKEKSFYKV